MRDSAALDLTDLPAAPALPREPARGLRRRWRLATILLVVGVIGAVGSSRADLFEVNSINDRTDASPGDGSCFTGSFVVLPTNPPLAEECTLRAAIEEANASVMPDVIEFGEFLPSSGSFSYIGPTSALPTITQPLTIDGYSAAGYGTSDPEATPVIQIGGQGLAVGGNADMTLLGLAIFDAPGSGMAVQDGAGTVTIQGCHIGVRNGLEVRGNRGSGVAISNRETLVGRDCEATTCSGRGNLISGNAGSGISAVDSIVTIAGNRIGTDRTGGTVVDSIGASTANAEWGIDYSNELSGPSRIGPSSLDPTAGNLISGNGLGGVSMGGGVNVRGNWIGTNAAGTEALPNLGPGVFHDVGASFSISTIGGSGANDGNLISGNTGAGIVGESLLVIEGNTIGLSLDHSFALGNGAEGIVLIGFQSTVADNTIAGNATHGLSVSGFEHLIVGNTIGTNAFGADLGSGLDGIAMSGTDSTIGEPGAGNTIGFHADGIDLATGSDGNTLQGNFIGVTPGGADIGNFDNGIEVASSFNLIGGFDGLTNSEGNTIGFNGDDGVAIGSTGSANQVFGNFIGTNAAGEDLGNDDTGILVSGSANGIGGGWASSDGAVRATGNVIAFHPDDGIRVAAGGAGNAARGNELFANALGIELGNDGSTPNDLGDVDTGANGLQNHPEFDEAQTQYNDVTDQLEVRYRVTSNLADAAYPLEIDFYLRESSDDEAGVYIGSDLYPTASATLYRLVAVDPLSGITVAGALVATATDADGNTSELSTQAIFVPEARFGAMLSLGVVLCAAAGRRGLPRLVGRSRRTKETFTVRHRRSAGTRRGR